MSKSRGITTASPTKGLWPLCHLAYVRPAFRASDWRAYEEVNAKFAEVVATESSTEAVRSF